MKSATPTLALWCSVIALAFTLWILVPAPMRLIWLVAVIAGEWSLFFGILALVGVFLGVKVRSKATRKGNLAILTGLVALVFALYPLITSLPVAESNNVQLSFARYALPSFGDTAPAVQTFTFSEADETPLALDVYTPPSLSENDRLPAVVVIHGGGWNAGTRSDFPAWNNWLTTQGYIVFDIDYRLAPQPNWQTATSDVQDAVRWIKSKADSLHVDPDHMALMGRSAGGHLALLAGYTSSAVDLDTQVQAVVSFYGPTDLRWGYANPANRRVIDGRATLRQFVGGTPGYIPEKYQQASPIHHVQSNTPPTLLIHGKQDQLVRSNHAVLLMDVLRRESSTPSENKILMIPYGQHGFDYNFDGWGSQIIQVVLLEHLNKHLKPASSLNP